MFPIRFLIATCASVGLLGILSLPAQLVVELEPDAAVDTGVDDEPVREDHSVEIVEELANDRLRFFNEDRLSGSFVSAGSDYMVWESPQAEEPIRFRLDEIAELELRHRGQGSSALSGLPEIQLSNGDRYRGAILRLDGETLVIDSPHAGEVSLRRSMVSRIRPETGFQALYEGPREDDAWEKNQSRGDQWTYENGWKVATGGNQIMGMQLEEFPDMARLRFRLQWKGSLNFQVGVWGNSPTEMNRDIYVVNIQNHFLRAWRHSSAMGGRQDFGNAHIQQLQQLSEMDATMYLNRPKKEITFWLDDALVGRWNDTLAEVPAGNSFLFASSGSTPMRITDIELTEWDGTIAESTEEPSTETDRVSTVNGDQFAGSLDKIENGIASFSNDFAEFNIPLTRISEIGFSSTTMEKPRLQAGDAEVTLGTGDRMTLRLIDWKEGIFSGDSEAAGTVRVNDHYISGIRLNPYDERHEEKESLW